MALCDNELLKRIALLLQLIDYSFYSCKINLQCPCCRYRAKAKTQTFHSLKALEWHQAVTHRSNWIYPFSEDDIKLVMRFLAKAMELGILPCQEPTKKNRVPPFPRVRRFFDENE